MTLITLLNRYCSNCEQDYDLSHCAGCGRVICDKCVTGVTSLNPVFECNRDYWICGDCWKELRELEEKLNERYKEKALKRGRPRISDKPMTRAEQLRKWREKHKPKV